MDLLGQAQGQRPELSGLLALLCLGANERPLMRSLCQQQEPDPRHCQPAGKGQGCIPPQVGTPCWALKISWDRLMRGCQPLHSGNPCCSKVTYLKFSRTTKGEREERGREVPEIRAGNLTLHPSSFTPGRQQLGM